MADSMDKIKKFEQFQEKYPSKKFSLCSSSPALRAEIYSWMKLSRDILSGSYKDFSSIDDYLSSRTYLCGSEISCADISLYFALANEFLSRQLEHVMRWSSLCKFEVKSLCGKVNLPNFQSKPQYSPISLPLPIVSAVDRNSEGEKERDETKKEDMEKAPRKVKPSTSDDNKNQTKEKKPKKDPKIETKVEVVMKDENTDECDPTMLDIRVGLIKKVWNHPEAEKLFCEEIDVGEESPRKIASGLRLFYNLEDLQNRKVLVLSNLKPRALVGFKSEGMVLCASNADHTIVKLVDPPKDAPIGSRITYPGKRGEPAAPSQLQKKKILEKVLPHLKTDDEGVPGFDGCPFTVEGFGLCATDVANGLVA